MAVNRIFKPGIEKLKSSTRFRILALVLIVFLAGLGGIYWPWHSRTTWDPALIKTSVQLDYPANFNYRQTLNNCGSYSTAAAIRALTGRDFSAEAVVTDMPWRVPNRLTFPWGPEQYLHRNNFQVETPSLNYIPDTERLSIVRERLSQAKPVIILIDNTGYQHYVTLLGFDIEADLFYVYDAVHIRGENGLTVDDNGLAPGNRSWSSAELSRHWDGGGVLGVYRWYAIVVSNSKSDS